MDQRLAKRQHAGNYRSLKHEDGLIDFCSNDYLGFARSSALKQQVDQELAYQHKQNGSTGSRLLAGNTDYAMQLENEIAQLHRCEAGLLFNSGYDANVGLFSSLPQRRDTVIHDELIHASVIDGIRLSNGNRYSFRHNDVQHLEEKLKRSTGRCYVAVESIYSMDGDAAPLTAIANLCEQYGAGLIVDEAHATGLFGYGLVQELQLQEKVLARVVTFGKALGAHGAIVLGSALLVNYLVNYARSFIYTTAAPLHQLAAISKAYEMLREANEDIQLLKQHIYLFKAAFQGESSIKLIDSKSTIQCIIIGDAQLTKLAASKLQQAGIDLRPILSPTVAAGSERLRICLHSFNTAEEITLLTRHIKQHLHDLT